MTKIVDSGNEMTQLTYEMYHILDDFLTEILNKDWMSGKSQLCLIGGIMINCDSNASDLFLPLKFEVHTKEGKMKDYLNEVFPNSAQTKKFL